MPKDYSAKHPDSDGDAYPQKDRAAERQQALTRYRRLQSLPRSELTLDDQLFIENFQAAMRLWWNVKI